MTRLLCLSALAFGLCTAVVPQSAAHAQAISIGRGGVQYNGYGQGYYGGYGAGYPGYGTYYGPRTQSYSYGPRTQAYSGYGYGPYGYGSRNTYRVPVNGGYGYGDGNYLNGYGPSGGYYAQPYAPTYRPYGFGVYIQ